MSKYRNKKTNGYDSRKEARRAEELQWMEQAGVITKLDRQVRYQLIPAQYEEIDGERKCVERGCFYIADFVYLKDGEEIVEDVKGIRTKDYIIKRKLMRYFLGIKIKEV